jgi:hypothetical protein
MLGRSSRRLVVLLIVGLAAFFFSGCGGGGAEPTTTSSLETVVTTLFTGGSGGVDPRIGGQIQPTQETPQAFVDVYQTQPLVLFFFVPGGRDDETVRQNLTALQPSFGQYTFFLFDYSDPEAYGDLATLLAVDYSPMIVMMDRAGTIRTIWSGFVDQGSLNQSLVNLGRD